MNLVTIGEAMDVAERAPAETSISTRHHTVSRGGTGRQWGTPSSPHHTLSRAMGKESSIVSTSLYHHSSVLCITQS